MPDLPFTIDLVADAPKLDIMRRLIAVPPPQVRQRAVRRAIAILHPIPRLAHIAIAGIDHQIWLRAQRAAPANEFVRAELIAFNILPSQLDARRPLMFGSDAIAPAITGDKVATGVTDHRHSQTPYRLQHIGTKAVFVRQGGAGFVDTAIDVASQMLGEIRRRYRD